MIFHTMRIVSEIMESNGSSSMASVCGGSCSHERWCTAKGSCCRDCNGVLSQMGKVHAILSDILGMEDHLGDMDFKIAGTAEGITAIQLDLKIEGLSFDLMEKH